MAGIFIDDFDNTTFDSIVGDEYHLRAYSNGDRDRSMIVASCYHHILDAFVKITGDDVNIQDSDQYNDLKVLADEAADEWALYFDSRTYRRSVLFVMFPKAEKIINKIKEPEDLSWVETFASSLDKLGYPRHWDTAFRQHAVGKGYIPSNALKLIQKDPNFILGEPDVQFIKKILDTYNP